MPRYDYKYSIQIVSFQNDVLEYKNRWHATTNHNACPSCSMGNMQESISSKDYKHKETISDLIREEARGRLTIV